jgi:hypothetical protein
MTKQEVWDIDIYSNLKRVLEESRNEILVASAWFTDNDLYDLLCEKVSTGLSVKIIISDHEDNKRLDFNYLISLGASVKIIPKNGRGMMHDKFCVIDNKIAISGSYNWTFNARKNNSESVICTQDLHTVKSFREKFLKMMQKEEISVIPGENMKRGLMNFLRKPFRTNTKKETKAVEDSSINIESISNLLPKDEFEQNLDLIISSEASDFDRDVLNKRGYDLAKKNHGDSKIIFKALDSIYSIFVYEIDIIEEKKQKLIAKINEYKIKTVNLLKSKSLLEQNAVESKCNTDKEEVNRKIDGLKVGIDTNSKTISDINDVRKKQKQGRIEQFKNEILQHEREFVKPKINVIDVVSNGLISFGLLIYLFFFYSSAGYILLYSVQDAKLAQDLGKPLAIQEVFNPKALSLAYDKGISAFIFIMLFVFIPLGCALFSSSIKRIEFTGKSNWFIRRGIDILHFFKKYSLVILLDGFIAYKVAYAIHEVAYLSGNTADKWSFSMAISNVDFYLVFVLGTAAVFLFEVFFNKIKVAIEARNEDVAKAENKLIIYQKNKMIIEIKEKMNILDLERSEIEKKNIELKNNLDSLERELIYLPDQASNKSKEIEKKQNVEIHSLDNKTEICISNIENDRFPISVDSLKDRISVFLEGWNELLHEEYSVGKAKQFSEEARAEADDWMQSKKTMGLNPNISNN